VDCVSPNTVDSGYLGGSGAFQACRGEMIARIGVLWRSAKGRYLWMHLERGDRGAGIAIRRVVGRGATAGSGANREVSSGDLDAAQGCRGEAQASIVAVWLGSPR
jgi:hypothetical protein